MKVWATIMFSLSKYWQDLKVENRKTNESQLLTMKHQYCVNLTIGKKQAQTASARHPQNLSTIPPSTGQNKCYANILLYETSLFYAMVDHFDYKNRCLAENNVAIAFIFPSRWWDGAESQGIEDQLLMIQAFISFN